MHMGCPARETNGTFHTHLGKVGRSISRHSLVRVLFGDQQETCATGPITAKSDLEVS